MIAFLFPGQGTQQKNMLSTLQENLPEIDEIFEAASDACGKDIKKICSSSDTALLSETINAQPVLTAINCATAAALKNRGIRPDLVAGHSLGQYSALICSGVLSLYDGFSLVAYRAKIMSEVKRKGKLCALVGLDSETVEKICADTGCEIALKNAPGQIVIGGDVKKVSTAAKKAEKEGALKAEILAVENAFHTSVMKETEALLGEKIAATTFSEPKTKLLLNCKGGPAETVEEIKNDLVLQCCHTVLWENCMRYLATQNPECVYEVGPGNVLSGLLKRINRKLVIKKLSEE